MSEHLPEINAWLDQVFAYGSVWVYLTILTACLIENLFPPFPGDTFIVAAGGLVALSRLDPFLSMAAICGGGMISAVGLFIIGRRYGRDFFIRKNYRLFSANDIARAEEKFARWGGLILVVSRFVVGLRVALIVGAGIAAYPAMRMVLYTLISYLLFSGLLMFLGFKLMEHLDKIETLLTTYNYIGWLIVVALIAWYLFRRAKNARKGSRI